MADVDDALGRLGAELAERDARIAELESALAGAHGDRGTPWTDLAARSPDARADQPVSERRGRGAAADGAAALPLGACPPRTTSPTTTGVGPPGPRRRRPVRAALPGGVPVRACPGSRSCAAARASEPPSPASRSPRSPTFTDADQERLLADPGIIRNRAKIDATLANARVLADWAAGRAGRADLVLRPRPGRPARPRATLADVPAVTPESTALAKALKKRGIRFVGPTTAYALMQACGLVDDHLADCVGPRALERRPAWPAVAAASPPQVLRLLLVDERLHRDRVVLATRPPGSGARPPSPGSRPASGRRRRPGTP